MQIISLRWTEDEYTEYIRKNNKLPGHGLILTPVRRARRSVPTMDVKKELPAVGRSISNGWQYEAVDDAADEDMSEVPF